MSEKKSDPVPTSVRLSNKSGVAEFFGVSVNTVDAWLRKGCPTLDKGDRGRAYVFDLLEVAKWRFCTGSASGETSVDNMTPTDRKAWFESEKARLVVEERDRELIAATEVERVVATSFAVLSQGLQSIPDNVERRTGCDPEVVVAVRDVIEKEMDGLADSLSRLYEEMPAAK